MRRAAKTVGISDTPKNTKAVYGPLYLMQLNPKLDRIIRGKGKFVESPSPDEQLDAYRKWEQFLGVMG